MGNNPRVISAQSKRFYVTVVEAKDDSGIIDLSALPVALAFLSQGTKPAVGSTWHTGSWTTVLQTNLDPIYQAKVLIGPGTAVVLAVGSWDVYVKVTHGTEVPIEYSDTILII